MSLALTVQMKVLTAVVEGLQSVEKESVREPHRTLPGISAPARNNKGWNAQDRFVFLRDWVTINFLGVLRRTTQERFYADEVLAMIPPYLEPEVSLIGETMVLIGTRDHGDRLAIPRRQARKLSEYTAWFDSDGRSRQHAPAIVRPVPPGFEVVSRGRLPVPATDQKQRAQFIIITRTPTLSAGKSAWDVL